jgi:hypothetical protein
MICKFVYGDYLQMMGILLLLMKMQLQCDSEKGSVPLMVLLRSGGGHIYFLFRRLAILTFGFNFPHSLQTNICIVP